MIAAGFSSGLFLYDSDRIQFRPFFCRLVSALRSRFGKELCSFDASGVVRLFCCLVSALRSRFRKELCSFDASGVVSVPSSGIKNNRGKQRLLIPSFKDLTILTVIFTFRLRSK